MAENPQKPGAPERPLSPHLSIYRWQVTMVASIVHRATGMGLSVGALVLAWWLVAISKGPEIYEIFTKVAASPLGFAGAVRVHLVNLNWPFICSTAFAISPGIWVMASTK